MKWSSIKTFEDIKLEKSSKNPSGIIKITINRPKLRNAFRPKTVFELKEAFNYSKEENVTKVAITPKTGIAENSPPRRRRSRVPVLCSIAPVTRNIPPLKTA